MQVHAELCWISPNLGGFQIGWETLMNMLVPDRDELRRIAEKLRRYEIRLAAKRMG